MTRARGVKPDLLRHEGLIDLEQRTGLPIRLCFIALFMACDRAGRFQWRARTLKAELMPMDELDFAKVMAALVEGDFVRLYEGPDKKAYGWVPGFTKHQNLNPRELASDLPPHPEEDAFYAAQTPPRTRPARVTHASGTVNRNDSTRDDAGQTNRKGIGKEKEEEGNGNDACASVSPTDTVEASSPNPQPEETADGAAALPGTDAGRWAEKIVSAYPGNGKRFEAIRAVLALLRSGTDPQTLLAQVEALAARWRALPPAARRFCPGLHGLFEDGRYADDPAGHPWVIFDSGSSGSNPEQKKIKAPAGAEEIRRLEAARQIWPDMPATTRWTDLTPEQRMRVQQSPEPAGA